MSKFPKKTPGRGEDKSDHWVHEPLRGGGIVHGWLAGDPVWVARHIVNRLSKPCRHEMTQGALTCDRCEAGEISDMIGYVPFYRDDGAPRFVIIPEYNASGVCGAQLHDALKCVRGKAKGDPVVIHRETTRPRYKPTSEHRKVPCDLEPTLLVLWGDAELRRYFASVSSRDRETTPTEPRSEIESAYDRAASSRQQAERDQAELADAVGRAVRVVPPARETTPTPDVVGDPLDGLPHLRAMVRSRNGKHPPAGE